MNEQKDIGVGVDEPIRKMNKPQNKMDKRQIRGLYSLCQITKSIILPIIAVDNLLKQTIQKTIASMIEGKCIVEGLVKKDSVKVLTYSSGLISGDKLVFDVIIECEVWFPVAGALINCVTKSINKGGIQAESIDISPSPFIIHISRDHFNTNNYFNSIKEGDEITVNVIAHRFELNDRFISIIGELVRPKEYAPKPRLEFDD